VEDGFELKAANGEARSQDKPRCANWSIPAYMIGRDRWYSIYQFGGLHHGENLACTLRHWMPSTRLEESAVPTYRILGNWRCQNYTDTVPKHKGPRTSSGMGHEH
jgi:hypothetical protein